MTRPSADPLRGRIRGPTSCAGCRSGKKLLLAKVDSAGCPTGETYGRVKTKRLRGGILQYVAQATSQVDTARAEKDRFRMETKQKSLRPLQGAKAIFALPPFSSAEADLVYPFTRGTSPARCTATFSPKQLQGEFTAPFHRFAPATGSLEKGYPATTPLHSLSKMYW